MEWIIIGLVIWNILLMVEIGRTKLGVRLLLVGLYKIGKEELTLQDFARECEQSKDFKQLQEEFERISNRK